MKTWSQSVLNRGEKLAFVLDGIVLNIAPLKDGAVLEVGHILTVALMRNT